MCGGERLLASISMLIGHVLNWKLYAVLNSNTIVVVTSCLYSAVSLPLVREQRFTQMIYCYYVEKGLKGVVINR